MPNEGMLPMGDQEVKESEPARPVQVVEPGVMRSGLAYWTRLFTELQRPEDSVVQGEELGEELFKETVSFSAIYGYSSVKFELSRSLHSVEEVGKLLEQSPTNKVTLFRYDTCPGSDVHLPLHIVHRLDQVEFGVGHLLILGKC